MFTDKEKIEILSRLMECRKCFLVENNKSPNKDSLLDQAQQWMSELERVHEEWVSISLPDDTDTVEVRFEDDSTYFGYYSADNNMWCEEDGDKFDLRVVAWRNIPRL